MELREREYSRGKSGKSRGAAAERGTEPHAPRATPARSGFSQSQETEQSLPSSGTRSGGSLGTLFLCKQENKGESEPRRGDGDKNSAHSVSPVAQKINWIPAKESKRVREGNVGPPAALNLSPWLRTPKEHADLWFL